MADYQVKLFGEVFLVLFDLLVHFDLVVVQLVVQDRQDFAFGFEPDQVLIEKTFYYNFAFVDIFNLVVFVGARTNTFRTDCFVIAGETNIFDDKRMRKAEGGLVLINLTLYLL